MGVAARRAPVLALLGGLLGAACDRSSVEIPEWRLADGFRWRPLSFEGADGARFRPVSPGRTGVDAATAVSEEARLANRTLVHGTGVALGDVDGDGWIDLYLCLLDGPDVLYRNLGGWRFEDVTERSGAAPEGTVSRGAVFADVDGDGDADLLVAAHGGPNVLLENDGTGVFRRVEAGFEGAYGSNTIALADVEGDGDLDAYIANYKVRQGDDLFSPSERSLQGQIRPSADGPGYEVLPPFDEHYRVVGVGGGMRRYELADPDEFYLNDGSGRFVRVPFDGGRFVGADGSALRAAPRDWGLVARFFDADDDGDPDLYVANDFGSADGFWLADGEVFRAASNLALRTTSASSMGVDFADIDADGDTDFVTTEMLAFDHDRRARQVAGVLVPRTPPGRAASRSPAPRNALQLNRGDGTYAEVARAAGVEASGWTWGAMFLDADLDGHEDLLITNGHAWDPLDGDTQEALRSGRIQIDWRRELGVFPPLELRNLAFRNLGDASFEEAGAAWGFGTEPDVSHGIASADLDRDGDLDVVITRFNEPPLLLRNETGRPRIALRVVGEAPNTAAVGARAVLLADGLPPQTRQVTAGGMYLSGSDPLLVFAAGASDSATLRVTWPSGGRRTLRVGTNTLVEVLLPGGAPGSPGEEGSAGPPRAAAEGLAAGGRAESPPQALLFEIETAGPTHLESEFDELARQPLLPLELSRLGPGVSWLDVDRDGDPDLVLPSAAGGAAAWRRNDGGRLSSPRTLGGPAPGDQTTVLSLPRGGEPVLVAGISGWEAGTPAELATIPPVVRLDGGHVPELPSTSVATGPLAAADVDADGDLDLFVGGRAHPGAYPRPAGGRLLRGEDGAWAEDAAFARALAGAGMVSGAVFSDVDLDGDPDLVLAIEWGPVRLFLNEAGAFREATGAWGLGDLTGRWNGVATGDLDGDGRPDLVATGWGVNAERRATPERPLRIRAGDLDGNGLVDIVESRVDADGRERPLRDFLVLSEALPFLRRAAPTFEAFAEATVPELLGPRLEGAYVAEAVTSSHTAFLNRGGGFEATPLPRAAQLAPAFGVVIADFDRDGREDVFVAQNFLATPQGVERHDAGRGAVLLGDGAGGLTALSASESGVAVYGDARGAAVADIDGDGRWDLAVAQNGGEALVFGGRGGNPGLRVRLVGPPGNPAAVGARVRVVYEDGEGPAREVQAGSGYWSANGRVQVFGLRGRPAAVRVWWPDGSASRVEVPPGSREVVVRAGGAAP